MPNEARQPIQLKMNFSGENLFASSLRVGQFVVLIEQNTPPRQQPFAPAMALSLAVAKRLATARDGVGLAVTDRYRIEDCHDPVDSAALLADASSKPVLMILSGKGASRDRMRDCLARAASHGIRNILAVSGDRSDQHVIKRSPTGRIAPYPGGYVDSVATLRLMQGMTTGLYAGAGINPYKYNAADQYLQYYKLLRKLACGAQFVVTHAGWDMKKLQELQWFLEMRDISVPILARIPLLSPADIQVIHDGLYPGVHAARLFYAMVQRESNLNAAQCMSAQLTRVGMQVAGCKLLGYSGVQLMGIQDVKTLEMVLARIQEACQQYRRYTDWLTAWNEYHSFIDFAPRPGAYYAFSRLLTPEQQHFSADTCTASERPCPDALALDRFRSFCLRWLLQPYTPEWLRTSARFLACGRCPQVDCGLRACDYLCPRECPKNLPYGACGGSAPDGTCEFGHATCFHHRVLALAARRHTLDRLEEAIAD